MKFAISTSIRNLNKEELLKRCTDGAILEKNDILEYLKSFSPNCYSSALVNDILEDQETDISEVGYTDGEYIWYSSWIYHFEKYNLKLNDDFIAHVLSKLSE